MRRTEDPIVPKGILNTPPATAGILITNDGRYLLQQRDECRGIWYPGYWGLFGGAIDSEETPQVALRRELEEELQFVPSTLTYFTQIGFDLSIFNAGVRIRYFYEVPVDEDEISQMTLNEGTAMKLFSSEALLQIPNLTPYDSIALRLHLTQSVIRGSANVT